MAKLTHSTGRGPRAVLLGVEAIALLAMLAALSGCGEIDAQAQRRGRPALRAMPIH